MSPNANYVNGRSLEYRVLNLFRKAGWQGHRTAGSHGEYDVVVWHRVRDVWPLTVLSDAGWKVSASCNSRGQFEATKNGSRVYGVLRQAGWDGSPLEDQAWIQCKSRRRRTHD